jgi:hypothetical protein
MIFGTRHRHGSARAAIVITAVLLAGCAAGRGPDASPTTRVISSDSMRILERAIADARPAYETQGQALAAGVYGGTVLAAGRTVEPLAPPRTIDASPVAPPRHVDASPVALLGESAEDSPEPTRPPVPIAAATQPGAPRPTPAPGVEAEPPALEPNPRRDGPAPSTGPGAPVPGGRFTIQIAAFRDPESAARVAREAGSRVADLKLTVEPDDGLFRVVAGGWNSEAEARSRLPELRGAYPSAWVRERPVP